MLRVGDTVVPVGNYKDEQLGEIPYMGKHVITEVKDTQWGQLVKTNQEDEWVSSQWFSFKKGNNTDIRLQILQLVDEMQKMDGVKQLDKDGYSFEFNEGYRTATIDHVKILLDFVEEMETNEQKA